MFVIKFLFDNLRSQVDIDSNTISNVASVAGVNWACAIQIMAAASIGSDLSFQATIPQTL